MQKVVLDTNILVSAAITDGGNPAKILDLALDSLLSLFYCPEMMDEYVEVLSRSYFDIDIEKKQHLLNGIRRVGKLIIPSVSNISLPDESDRIFYDTAQEVGAFLITGNTKHYPVDDSMIITPGEFVKLML